MKLKGEIISNFKRWKEEIEEIGLEKHIEKKKLIVTESKKEDQTSMVDM